MKDEVKFCPRCGVASVERDRYGEERTPPRFKCEWLCSACGFGFLVDRSLRSTIAAQIANQMRKMRPPSVKKDKPRPDDEKLNTLRRYAEKIDMQYLIFRSEKKPWLFKFCTLDGICTGCLTFERAMILLRGYELAARGFSRDLVA